ncbi:MAG: hypothetical protein ABIO36_09655 [Pyrinomonadaceae bacterium]
MSVIKPSSYAQEQRLKIPIAGSQSCYVVSGLADFSSLDAHEDGHPTRSKIHGVGTGSSDERWFAVDPIHLVVGPKWNIVDDVSPTLSVAGVSFLDSDETDALGYEITSINWDTIDDPETGTGKRIRLKVGFRMCGGEQSSISMFAYHLVALGSIFSIHG